MAIGVARHAVGRGVLTAPDLALSGDALNNISESLRVRGDFGVR